MYVTLFCFLSSFVHKFTLWNIILIVLNIINFQFFSDETMYFLSLIIFIVFATGVNTTTRLEFISLNLPEYTERFNYFLFVICDVIIHTFPFFYYGTLPLTLTIKHLLMAYGILAIYLIFTVGGLDVKKQYHVEYQFNRGLQNLFIPILALFIPNNFPLILMVYLYHYKDFCNLIDADVELDFLF